MQLDSKIVILLVFGVLVSLETTTAAPIVSQTDNTVDINVWPFFKMSLDKTGGTDLDIEVLSGLVRVGYERRNGQKPNVGVSVFGIGNLPGKEPEPVSYDDGN